MPTSCNKIVAGQCAACKLDSNNKKSVVGLGAHVKELDAVRRNRGQFSAAVAHDLRQNAQAVTLLAQAALNNCADAAINELLELILQSALQNNALIARLAETAHIDLGHFTPKPEQISVSQCLAGVREEIQAKCDEASIELRWKVPCADIRSDAKLLEPIMHHLLVNAVTHSEATKILVGIKRRAPGLDLIVADNGVGLSEQVLARITTDQMLHDWTVTGPGERWGVGLQIVCRLCHLGGHTLDVRSIPGRGTVYRIAFEF